MDGSVAMLWAPHSRGVPDVAEQKVSQVVAPPIGVHAAVAAKGAKREALCKVEDVLGAASMAAAERPASNKRAKARKAGDAAGKKRQPRQSQHKGRIAKDGVEVEPRRLPQPACLPLPSLVPLRRVRAKMVLRFSKAGSIYDAAAAGE